MFSSPDGDGGRQRPAAKSNSSATNIEQHESAGQADVIALSDLAHNINETHEAAVQSFHKGIEHALNCGRLLLAAKDAVPRGEWLPWLEANCTVSVRMAQYYMRLVKQVPKLAANTQRVSFFSLREALAAASKRVDHASRLPEPVVAAALNESTDSKVMSALQRADNHVKHTRARQNERVESETAPETSTVLGPSQLSEIDDLLGELRDVVARWHRDRPELRPQAICDALNAVYCEVQDGKFFEASGNGKIIEVEPPVADDATAAVETLFQAQTDDGTPVIVPSNNGDPVDGDADDAAAAAETPADPPATPTPPDVEDIPTFLRRQPGSQQGRLEGAAL
jgi:hypothetical protein